MRWIAKKLLKSMITACLHLPYHVLYCTPQVVPQPIAYVTFSWRIGSLERHGGPPVGLRRRGGVREAGEDFLFVSMSEAASAHDEFLNDSIPDELVFRKFQCVMSRSIEERAL